LVALVENQGSQSEIKSSTAEPIPMYSLGVRRETSR
jgi:hypothetical protein